MCGGDSSRGALGAKRPSVENMKSLTPTADTVMSDVDVVD